MTTPSCHPDGPPKAGRLQPQRIPWILAIISNHYCAWDSSLPAFDGPARRTAGLRSE